VIGRSGHSTYWLLVPPERKDFDQYWKKLKNLGCSYESTTKRFTVGYRTLYSVDIPPDSNIDAVLAVLEQGKRAGVWIFQQAHCAHRLDG
jgi:uncharacterized protein DUF4265